MKPIAKEPSPRNICPLSTRRQADQALCGRHLLVALILAGIVIPPASGMERQLRALGFERSLSSWELRRTVQRQTKTASLAASDRPESAKPSAPKIRRISAATSPEPVSGTMKARREQYASLVFAEAQRQSVDPNLVHAVIRAESAYRPKAKSPAGACGLMQLMPATAKRFGVRDIWDPAQNIQGGVAYLRFLLDRFDGDIPLVLAAYNAGEGAVAKYGNRIPPYAETQKYVAKVMASLG